MGEVVQLDVSTSLDISPAKVCEGAIEAELKSVMLMGWDKDDQLYVAASTGDLGELLLLLELAKQATLDQVE